MSVNTKVNGELVKSAGLYSVSKPVGMADIYSTEEKEVGLWKNNKPLYQKTLVYNKTNIQGNSTFDITSDLSEVETIYDFKSSIDYSVGSATATEYADNYAVLTKDGNSYKIKLAIGSTTLTTADITITIQYTKTTDTPWSGKFVPQGYGYVSSGDIYSTQERQVGVWTDGKPLYQKTVYCGDGENNQTIQIAHNIANIESVANVWGCFTDKNNGQPISFPNGSEYVRLNVEYDKIYVKCVGTWAGYKDLYVTIQYTKTTDVAGSGEYVPSGDKAEHYSTDEEVIGTFLGETLYRKTVNTGSLPNNTDKSVAHGISNLGRVINVCGNAKNTTNNYYIPLPYSQTDVSYQVAIYCDNTNIHLVTSRDTSAYNESYVTLEYTKTS